MNLTGSSNTQEAKPKTFLGRFNAFRDRYRVQTSVALAVLAALAFIAAEIVPAVQQFIITTGLLQYITLLVLLDLTISIYQLLRPPTMKVAKNQDESMPMLIEALPHCRIEGVYLLEYAGATTLPLIRAIQREGVPLRILLKHPETISGLQRQRNIATLDTICNSIFEDYKGSFEIRCYRLPYTLRSRCLGKELLELGWLTPDVKRQTAFGHGNPSLVVDLSNRSNEHLYSFFRTTFETYWNDPGTEDGRAVLEHFSASA
jgi:hypothetical protein